MAAVAWDERAGDDDESGKDGEKRDNLGAAGSSWSC